MTNWKTKGIDDVITRLENLRDAMVKANKNDDLFEAINLLECALSNLEDAKEECQA